MTRAKKMTKTLSWMEHTKQRARSANYKLQILQGLVVYLVYNYDSGYVVLRISSHHDSTDI